MHCTAAIDHTNAHDDTIIQKSEPKEYKGAAHNIPTERYEKTRLLKRQPGSDASELLLNRP